MGFGVDSSQMFIAIIIPHGAAQVAGTIELSRRHISIASITQWLIVV